MEEDTKSKISQLKSFLSSNNIRAYESAIVGYVVADSAVLSSHHFKWSYGYEQSGGCECDLFGCDMTTGVNIYVEIKSTISRTTLLRAINDFRKGRTVGFNTDLYLIVSYDIGSDSVRYYDVSTVVKSSQVEIKDVITKILSQPKGTITEFLGDTKTERVSEVVGDVGIPNVLKRNVWPLIAKVAMYCVALAVLLVLLILNACGIYVLSFERLILIGMIAVVCLIFFVKEIKFKDFSLSTINAKDK